MKPQKYLREHYELTKSVKVNPLKTHFHLTWFFLSLGIVVQEKFTFTST